MVWKLAEAESRLSELMALATTEGPQTIRQHDASVVVVSELAYRELVGGHPTLKDLILNGPSLEDVLPPRDGSSMREVGL